MPGRRRSPAWKRARARQETGDPRPYMMILQEEKMKDAKINKVGRSKPTENVFGPGGSL